MYDFKAPPLTPLPRNVLATHPPSPPRYPEALRLSGSEALNPFELAMIVRLANLQADNAGQNDDTMITSAATST